MWDIISTILTSPAGSFAFVFGILALCFWVVYKVTKHVTKWECKLEKVDSIENCFKETSSAILQINARLSVMESQRGSLTQSHSPVGLSQLGETVADKIKAYDIVERNWDRIQTLIDRQNLDNPYDIQQFCIDKATIAQDELFSKEDVDYIKKFAFSEGMPTAYYGGMFGVIIRNQYFKVKNIDINDVDKHDPNQKK
nr:MAG TPA: protein of unknown function (DUF4750) [Caudoviricetes sp.]